VLHNVGNVLNSANVLGSSIMEHLPAVQGASVGRLAALLVNTAPSLAGS